jgi:hypothetical protein
VAFSTSDGSRTGGAHEAVEVGAELAHALRLGGEEVPDLRVLRGERLDHLRAHAADQDRRMRTLHRLRHEWRVLRLVVLAVERGRVLGEELRHHLDGLDEAVRAAAGRVEGDAVGLVLLLEPAGAHAEDHAPAAHVVDGRGHLRDDDREAVRVARHEDADTDALRARRERGQERPALQARPVRVALDGDEVVVHERGVQSERVGLLPHGGEVSPGGVVRHCLDAEAQATRRRRRGRRLSARQRAGGGERRGGAADHAERRPARDATGMSHGFVQLATRRTGCAVR